MPNDDTVSDLIWGSKDSIKRTSEETEHFIIKCQLKKRDYIGTVTLEGSLD